MNNNNNNKKKNNYFTKAIQKYNTDDFIKFKSPRELQNDATTIFRDICAGRIDIDAQKRFFLDPALLEALLKVAYDKWIYHSISYNAINYQLQNIPEAQLPQETRAVMEKHNRSTFVYFNLCQAFNAIKVSRNPDNLYVLASNVSNYRNDL